ncbi:MAG: hypothetical protein JETT_0788 [Candidatus Jettenia ecosi]|uniref:Uncharacterized protein n=1 Tax=Candidatus Jettenia ecosi TaxID=2494326 RepID=A0A533QDW2_9BACT|nr:MAG: hypothetical protein JETT_0788 [Candidatus Jettenia ecosi]
MTLYVILEWIYPESWYLKENQERISDPHPFLSMRTSYV